MKTTAALAALTVLAFTFGAHGQSVVFDPLFRVTLISGDVKVKPPEAPAPVGVKPGHAYPFGTQITTPVAGWAELALSSRDFCKLLGGSTLTLTEEKTPERLVLAHLAGGEFQCNMADSYAASGNRLALELAGARVMLLSGRSTLKVSASSDARESVVAMLDGTASIKSAQFEIPILPANHVVALSHGEGRLSLRVIKGTVSLGIRDRLGAPQTVELPSGSMLKVFERFSPEINSTSVVLMLLNPEGSAQPLPGQEAAGLEDPSIRYTIKHSAP